MAKYNQVLYYTKGQAVVTVNFPEDKVACKWCPLFLRYEDAYKRYSCRLTGEWLMNPLVTVGMNCPLEFEKDENDGTEV